MAVVKQSESASPQRAGVAQGHDDSSGVSRRLNQGLDRALELLALLAEGPATLTELTVQSGVHKTTVLRMLQTLELRGFVKKIDSSTYRLGTRLFSLAHRALEDLDVRTVAAEALTQLAEACGQTIHLAVRDGFDIVYIDKREGRTAVRMYSRIGARLPMYCTALGKAMLANYPRDVRASMAAQFKYHALTPDTITSAEGLLADLELVRERGYAIDERENEENIRCIAAPVRRASGRAHAAISISVPVSLMELDELIAHAPLLVETADLVSREYGWEPGLLTRPDE